MLVPPERIEISPNQGYVFNHSHRVRDQVRKNSVMKKQSTYILVCLIGDFWQVRTGK